MLRPLCALYDSLINYIVVNEEQSLLFLSFWIKLLKYFKKELISWFLGMSFQVSSSVEIWQKMNCNLVIRVCFLISIKSRSIRSVKLMTKFQQSK